MFGLRVGQQVSDAIFGVRRGFAAVVLVGVGACAHPAITGDALELVSADEAHVEGYPWSATRLDDWVLDEQVFLFEASMLYREAAFLIARAVAERVSEREGLSLTQLPDLEPLGDAFDMAMFLLPEDWRARVTHRRVCADLGLQRLMVGASRIVASVEAQSLLDRVDACRSAAVGELGIQAVIGHERSRGGADSARELLAICRERDNGAWLRAAVRGSSQRFAWPAGSVIFTHFDLAPPTLVRLDPDLFVDLAEWSGRLTQSMDAILLELQVLGLGSGGLTEQARDLRDRTQTFGDCLRGQARAVGELKASGAWSRGLADFLSSHCTPSPFLRGFERPERGLAEWGGVQLLRLVRDPTGPRVEWRSVRRQ